MINSFAKSMTPIARSFTSCFRASLLIVRAVHPSVVEHAIDYDSLGMCLVDF